MTNEFDLHDHKCMDVDDASTEACRNRGYCECRCGALWGDGVWVNDDVAVTEDVEYYVVALRDALDTLGSSKAGELVSYRDLALVKARCLDLLDNELIQTLSMEGL